MHGATIKYIYKVSQEERSILWEVIVSAILSKKLYTNMCPFRTVSEIEPFDCIVVSKILRFTVKWLYLGNSSE
jgi:hypothetical protein